MGRGTDAEYAWAAFEKKLENGELENLDQQDCTKTLIESGDWNAYFLAHQELDRVIDEAAGGTIRDSVINQIKKLKLKFKLLRDEAKRRRDSRLAGQAV